MNKEPCHPSRLLARHSPQQVPFADTRSAPHTGACQLGAKIRGVDLDAMYSGAKHGFKRVAAAALSHALFLPLSRSISPLPLTAAASQARRRPRLLRRLPQSVGRLPRSPIRSLSRPRRPRAPYTRTGGEGSPCFSPVSPPASGPPAFESGGSPTQPPPGSLGSQWPHRPQ